MLVWLKDNLPLRPWNNSTILKRGGLTMLNRQDIINSLRIGSKTDAHQRNRTR